MAQQYNKKKTPMYIWISLIAIVVALIGFVLYGYFSGWSFEQIFTSNLAFVIYALLVLWGVVIGKFKLDEWSKK